MRKGIYKLPTKQRILKPFFHLNQLTTPQKRTYWAIKFQIIFRKMTNKIKNCICATSLLVLLTIGRNIKNQMYHVTQNVRRI